MSCRGIRLTCRIKVNEVSRYDKTEMGGSHVGFPTTHWSMLAAVCGEMTDGHRSVLNLLIQRYWKPVYYYIRRRGHSNEDAKDLVQEFFTSWLVKELFGRADPTRGRFRSLLLSSLDNFIKNAHRANHAKRRRPPGGIIALDALLGDAEMVFEPSDDETPERAFNRTWVRELLLRVLVVLEQEYHLAGKDQEYELFRIRAVAPALEGAESPPMVEIANELGLTQKQASNRLVTARRAYQRLLREEVRLFASSDEDVAAEIRDLFEFLGRA